MSYEFDDEPVDLDDCYDGYDAEEFDWYGLAKSLKTRMKDVSYDPFFDEEPDEDSYWDEGSEGNYWLEVEMLRAEQELHYEQLELNLVTKEYRQWLQEREWVSYSKDTNSKPRSTKKRTPKQGERFRKDVRRKGDQKDWLPTDEQILSDLDRQDRAELRQLADFYADLVTSDDSLSSQEEDGWGDGGSPLQLALLRFFLGADPRFVWDCELIQLSDRVIEQHRREHTWWWQVSAAYRRERELERFLDLAFRSRFNGYRWNDPELMDLFRRYPEAFTPPTPVDYRKLWARELAAYAAKQAEVVEHERLQRDLDRERAKRRFAAKRTGSKLAHLRTRAATV